MHPGKQAWLNWGGMSSTLQWVFCCLAGWQRWRDRSHMFFWDTLSVVCDWPWPAHTAAGCLELNYKNRLPQLYIQMSIKQATKQCYSWMLMGPSVETARANQVTDLKTCLCLCVGLAAGLGEVSPAGKSCRALLDGRAKGWLKGRQAQSSSPPRCLCTYYLSTACPLPLILLNERKHFPLLE